MNEENKFSALHDWFQTPQGQGVARAFAAELQPMHSFLCGQNLLQLGDCGDNLWLDTFHYRSTWVISPALSDHQHYIRASVAHLPLDRESIDCIIAPLTMEACAHEKNPLDEMDRALKPMGYMVFLGINPWSFWGMSLRWGRLSCFARAAATVSSSLSLKHALLMRGYKLCWLKSFYYIPPVENPRWIHKLEFLNQMGKMIWPYPPGYYCLIMQKYTPGMTAIACETSQDVFSWAQP